MNIETSNDEPYQHKWKLYVMHLFFVFTSRMWDMGAVFLIADLTNNSLGIIALAGLLNNLFIVLFMSHMGKYLDETNRLLASEIALSVKFVTLTSAYGICAYLAHGSHNSAHDPLIYVLPVLCAIAGLSFNTISQSVEKDWIVVLSAGDSVWLSTTNSIMTQIDSGVNSIAPAMTGYLFISCSPSLSAIILLLSNLVTTIFLYFFMRGLYHSWPALARRETKAETTTITLSPTKSNVTTTTSISTSTSTVATSSPIPSSSLSVSWLFSCCSVNEYEDFWQSGCAGAMVSYAFLYLTVLNFGSLMTVYLRSVGVSDGWIGLARGGAAFTGFLGAVIFPFINARFGLYTTSAIAIIFQEILVVAAAISFFFFSPHIIVLVLIFAVLLSRTGLWMFDLGVRQIAQETIPEYCRGKVNGQWRAMTAFFEMSSYVLALLIQGTRYFWVLTSVSATVVTLAMLLFVLGNDGGRHNEHHQSYVSVSVEVPSDNDTPREEVVTPFSSLFLKHPKLTGVEKHEDAGEEEGLELIRT
jgi:iron-regulated transporter 1